MHTRIGRNGRQALAYPRAHFGKLAALGIMSFVLAGTAHADTPNPDQPTDLAMASTGFGTSNMSLRSSGKHSSASNFDAAGKVKQGFAMLRGGSLDQAVKVFDTVIQNSELQLAGDTRERLCRLESSAGNATTQQVTEMVAVNPAVCDAHFGKGFALIDLGRGDQAEVELQKATQMAPDNAHFANEYAELFKSRRDWQGSYDAFARAWAVVDRALTGPDADVAARALRGMGFNKAQMGQYEEAEVLFRQSLDYQPGNEIALVELGNIARRKVIGS